MRNKGLTKINVENVFKGLFYGLIVSLIIYILLGFYMAGNFLF